MGLFQRIAGWFGGKRHISTLEDYAETLNQFIYGGNTYPLSGVGIQQTLTGEKVERIPNSLEGFAQSAYASNGVVFACMAVRQLVFSAIRFQYQQMRSGRPGRLFGGPELGLVETPWVGGTTQDMLARMIQDADLAGNSYWVKLNGELVRMRPDWVDIVLEPRMFREGIVGYRRAGYLYTEGGAMSGAKSVPFLPDEVVHFAPHPDPLASFRGMSWLTPVIRDIQNDGLMTRFKRKFLENGATPNLVIKGIKAPSKEAFDALVDMMEERHAGVRNAFKTLYLTEGVDAEAVGANLQQLDYKVVQGHLETRIAMASGVHPVIAGLSEGMQGASLNAGNFSSARRRFADGTMHPLWQNAAGSMQQIIRPPTGSRLWYDARDVPFLREDAKDEAEILQTRMLAIESGIRGGFKPDTCRDAIATGDIALLEHTGLFSVQLQPPGRENPEPDDPQRAMTVTDKELAEHLMSQGWTRVQETETEEVRHG